ncbi:hypothetical protein POTOM_014436 [Populus tomentosa]|uniref:Trafficking protein particle complex subunit 2 n=1 Tax=Populus tomentosa TaxID=118781 RepID=A0A8X8A6U6_POPTO|nr:hypothetical protein POTOM_014436 [Populus tomentosa]
MTTTACFIIVSRNDIPIYEAEVGSATKREDAAQMHQFILHAALDIVQDLAWTTSAMYLKAIDRFNDMVVSVYVTAGHILCICDFVCYSNKRNYTYLAVYAKVSRYYEIVTTNKQSWAVYAFHNHIEILLNPLYLPGSRITSSHFDTKVRALARKYL